ncbi:aldehyde dehydrogenase family protein, partial [Salmonella sp. SAL4437]|uniref:aldehyde dehydrogenase family protein n=1 Tax=Salmonella sp. SAL4437 TaxID=3159892 RepID=UPI0039781356
IYDDFISELVQRAETITVGPASDPSSDTGPVVAQSQLDTVERYVEIGQQEGAKLLIGGERPANLNGGYFYKPTIFAGDNSMKIAQEEIFG